jgi:flagellar protein FlgJ
VSADKNDPKALEAAAKQFEALFIQQMLKSMRDASLADGAFDSDEGRMYLDMFDKQISLTMAQGKGFGLADMLVKQLRTTAGKVEDIHSQQHSAHETSANNPAFSSPGSAIQHDALQKAASVVSQQTKTVEIDKAAFATPQAFVQGLWPLAQKAGQQLGVAPKVLLAQAALETGWGKNINKCADGSSSYNLFNIKAGERWPGNDVNVTTHEFHDDVAVKEDARFRAYSGFAESFDDYVAFIKSNPRYQSALQQASDPQQYTHELQRAGYATDPEYSRKIMGVMNGLPMQQALETVKLSLGETITSKEGS